MQRVLLCGATFAFVALAAALLIVNQPVEAKKSFDDGDLDGVYAWVNSEVQLEGGVTEYCSGYGTIEFYGDGTAMTEGFHRCLVAGSFTTAELMDYAVEPDGQFLLWEDDNPAYQTHCRLVDRGAMVLCDGTASHPEMLAFSAIAVKQ